MTVLVTGGAGFIGSHLAERLLAHERRVVVLDDFDPYYDTGLKERNVDRCRDAGGDRFDLVEASITDEDAVESTMAAYDVEVVYHEASKAGVRTSVDDPRTYHEVNTTGLLTLLTSAVDHGVERVVNASSSSVYGEADYLPYDEAHPTRPQSPYAVTKLTGEHYCRIWDDLFDIATVNLRYFGVYGPRMRPNMAITNFTSRCLNGEPPIVFGDGEQSRDFTYIDDIVGANLTLLSTDAADGETMNVGSGGNITVRELAEQVIEETGADVEPIHEAPRRGEARHTHADVSKAAALIGYEPTTDIREGVSRFVEWYRANRDWYEPLVLGS